MFWISPFQFHFRELYMSFPSFLRYVERRFINISAYITSHHGINCKQKFLRSGWCFQFVSTSNELYAGKKMDNSIEASIKRAARAIKDSKTMVITAGAGMGVDSGLPDFRGPEGFWRAYPPLQKLGLTLPEMSTPRWFFEDPQFAWGFFGHRFNLYRNTKPHKGFEILKQWADSKPNGYFVFTSNVDGHFQKAGFEEDRIAECHGSINFLQQVDGKGGIWPFPDDLEVKVDEGTLMAHEPLPTVPPDVPQAKKKLARPNILMFGDWYFVDSRTYEQESRFDAFAENCLLATSDPFVVIEIGAGLAVPTVRWKSQGLVSLSNGTLIRINPRDTDIPSSNDISLPIGGLEALQKLDQEVQSFLV